jgi:hypothetical protein
MAAGNTHVPTNSINTTNYDENKVNEELYLHGETEGSTKIPDEEKFHEIVDGTVNPSSSLTEEDFELIRDDSLAYRVGNKDLFSMRESLQHQCRQISIFSKEKQILLVQSINDILLISRDDIWIRENRDEVSRFPLGGFES